MKSRRLDTVVGFISLRTLADIGTDHGYVPVQAYERGLVDRAIACDISAGSLEKAAINIAMRGLEKVIQTRLGDGLSKILPGEVQTVTIAGVGGRLAAQILTAQPEVIHSITQLIIQPQSDIPFVRRICHELGFCISEEIMLKENGKYYNIMNCYCGSDDKYTDLEYEYGKKLIEKKDTVLKDYLMKIINGYDRIYKSMCGFDMKPETAGRASEIENLIAGAKDVFDCL